MNYLKYRKNILLFLFVVCFLPLQNIYSQQDPQFSHFMFIRPYFNTSNIGLKPMGEVSLLHRTQWAGYTTSSNAGGAPNTQLLSFSLPIPIGENDWFGTGIIFSNDILGNESNREGVLGLTYHRKTGKGVISFGIRAGVYNKSIDFNQFRPLDLGDPLITTGNRNSFTPDMSAGISYTHANYYVGIGVNHLLNNAFNFPGVQASINKLAPHFYLQAGTQIKLNKVTFLPNLIVKTELSSFSFEINSIVEFNNKFYTGFSLREIEAMVMYAGIYLFKNKKMQIGYAFDFTLEATNAKQATSHEILITYRFPTFLGLRKKIIRTPRFRHD